MKNVLLLPILLLCLLIAPASAAHSSVEITVSGSAPAGYETEVTVSRLSGMDADYANIRFFAGNTSAQSGTSLPYWIESYTTSAARVWIPLPAGTTKVYCEWGIPGETVSESNGTAVFACFDDFSGIRPAAWWYSEPAWVSVHDGILDVRSVNIDVSAVPNSAQYLPNYTVMMRTKTAHDGALVTDVFERPAGFYINSYETFFGVADAVAPSPKLANVYTASSVTYINEPWEANTYYTVNYTRTNTATSVSFDNNTITDTGNVFPGVSNVRIRAVSTSASTTAEIWTDWFAIRQYVATEPVATVGSTVTTASDSGFSMDDDEGRAPLTVHFTDTSTNTPTSWAWDFGDGGSSTAQNPSHAFNSPGTYTVTLTARNALGSSTATNTVTVELTPAFSANVTSGTVPRTVQFTDTSADSPTSWAWSFGDGGTSTAQSPVHTYTVAGTYTVQLTTSNAVSSSVETKTGYMVLSDLPATHFNYIRQSSLTYNFQDLSLNDPTSWAWDFGDGSTATTQNPTHTYAAGGSYNVTLTASNAYGSKLSYVLVDTSLSNTPQLTPVGETWQHVAFNESKEFSFLTPYGVITSHWFVNDVEINYTSMNMSYTFDMPGRAYNVSVWAETTEGNSSMLEYRVMVGREVATEHVVPFNDTNYNNLMNSTLNMDTDGILSSLFAPLTDSMGRIVYLVLFVLPFVYMWLNQGKMTIPTTLSLIVGSLLVGFIPSQFMSFIAIAIVLSFASAFYKLSRGPS
jgi:PKD repeat protein